MTSKTIGQVVETNIAMPIAPQKSHVIGTAFETDTAMPIMPVIASALLPPLAEAVHRLDQLSAFHAHPPPDHHDSIALYTDASLALAAFVVAIYVLLRRLNA